MKNYYHSATIIIDEDGNVLNPKESDYFEYLYQLGRIETLMYDFYAYNEDEEDEELAEMIRLEALAEERNEELRSSGVDWDYYNPNLDMDQQDPEFWG